MSEENIELMRTGYEAAARGDMAFVLGLMDPEVEVRDRPEAPDPATYRGHEGVIAAFTVSLDMFEDFTFAPERYFEAGDHVVVVLVMTGRGKASGVPVEERIAHLWTIRDGRAVELQVYSDPDDALEAAGLPPEGAQR